MDPYLFYLYKQITRDTPVALQPQARRRPAPQQRQLVRRALALVNDRRDSGRTVAARVESVS